MEVAAQNLLVLFVMKLRALSSLALLLALSICAHAQSLIGSSVTGSLQFSGNTTNFFDPSNGFVPPGFGNSTSPTVTVDGGVEFGFRDSSNFDTADFSLNTLFIQDITSALSGPSLAFRMTFMDAAFLNFSGVTLSADTFGLTFSLLGDTLTIDVPQFNIQPAQFTRSALFTFNSPAGVPESGTTVLLLCLGLASTLVMRRIVASRVRKEEKGSV